MATSPTDPDPFQESVTSAAHEQVMEFINSRINFERIPAEQYELQDFKLDRMQELLARLGDPQRAIPAVHIAGTKGKGSTAAMTAAILSASGSRIGLFTSPHIETVGERMTIDGEQPTGKQLDSAMEIVIPIVEEMDSLGPSMRPTFFECITAIAWVHFHTNRVSLVVLEAGLGGRLDATNVCTPLATVITSISRDHERLLGNTLADIAAEKAGIIKSNVPVLSGVIQPEPRDVIHDVAESLNCDLYELDHEIQWSIVDTLPSPGTLSRTLSPLVVDVQTPWRSHRVRVPLPGEHQARNLALALSTCDLLSQQHTIIPNNAIKRRLAQLRWPLRIEVLRQSPLTIVDAAHNDGSIDSLIDTLKQTCDGKRILIFATSKDKDAVGMLDHLDDHFDEAIITQFIGNPRSVPVDTLADIAQQHLTIPFTVAPTPAAAWILAQQQASPNDLICATGSFFLAAEMRTIIRDSSQST